MTVDNLVYQRGGQWPPVFPVWSVGCVCVCGVCGRGQWPPVSPVWSVGCVCVCGVCGRGQWPPVSPGDRGVTV